MIEIYRGMTPRVKWVFKIVDPETIVQSALTIEQCGSVIVDKDIESATVEGNMLVYRLTQEDTLALSCGTAKMQHNFLFRNGEVLDRGVSHELSISVKDNQKDEVMSYDDP